MPNRYQSAAKQEIYETIAKYEGNYCLACFIEGAGRRGPKSGMKLQIDHAGRERHLLCQTHNLDYRRLTLEEHESLMADYSAENVRKRVKESLPIKSARTIFDYKGGSVEMQVNSEAEDEWIRFNVKWIEANGFINYDTSVNAGAIAACNINPSSTERYYKKWKSALGLFQETKENGERGLVFRPDYISLRKKVPRNGQKES